MPSTAPAAASAPAPAAPAAPAPAAAAAASPAPAPAPGPAGPFYSLVVFVPTTHAKAVREALAASGAGAQGFYDSCSFSSVGVGRFRPLRGATPAIGKVGSLEVVAEERIETEVARERLAAVLAAVRAAHPYEVPGIHVVPLVDVSGAAPLPPRDELAELRARVAVVEDSVRETLAGLAEDMAVWQAAAKAQIDDVRAASSQARRSRDAVAAAKGGGGDAGGGGGGGGARAAGGSDTASPLASRTNTGDSAGGDALRPASATAPIRALERRLIASEGVLSEHEAMLRQIAAERAALAAAAAALGPAPPAAGGGPTNSIVAPRPYSAPLNALDRRLKGVEAVLSEQTSVLEDHNTTLQVLQAASPAARAAARGGRSSPSDVV